MKRRLALLAACSATALAFGAFGAAPAFADAGPHKSTAVTAAGDVTLNNVGAGRCAGCHRTHTAKAALLLKAAQPALCFTCHSAGTGATTDVVNGVDSNDANQALRGGGFDYALINSGAASKHMEPPTTVGGRWVTSAQTVPVLAVAQPVTSKHQINGTTSGTIWGNGAISATENVGKANVTLECGSCHDPHGNGNYRILKPMPVDSGAAAPGVNVPDAGAKVYTTTNYWKVGDPNVPKIVDAANPTVVQPDGYIANVSQWCSTCHTRYMAKAPDYETDSGDAVFRYRHTSGRTDKAGVSRPNCIQCHVSHGSNAAMTGTAASFTAPDGAVPVTGTSRLLRIDNRGTCVMCHNV